MTENNSLNITQYARWVVRLMGAGGHCCKDIIQIVPEAE